MSEEKRKVLEMLEQGKINVEEAQKLAGTGGERRPQEEARAGKEGPAAAGTGAGAGNGPTNRRKRAWGPAVFSTPGTRLAAAGRFAGSRGGGRKSGRRAAAPRGKRRKEVGGGAAREQTPRYEYETCPPPPLAGNMNIPWTRRGSKGSGPFVDQRPDGGARVGGRRAHPCDRVWRTALPEGGSCSCRPRAGADRALGAGGDPVWPLALSKHLVVELPAALAAGLGRVKCANVAERPTLTGLCAPDAGGKLDLRAGIAGWRDSPPACEKHFRRGARRLAAQAADFGTTSGAVEAWGSAEVAAEERFGGAAAGLGPMLLRQGGACHHLGGIVLTLPGEIGFTAKFSSVSGRFSTDFQVEGEMGGKQGKVVHGDRYATSS